MEVIDFLKQNKELFQVPVDQVDWKKIYELAFYIFEGNLGEFTKFWLNKNIHPEKYLTKLPDYFLSNTTITSFEIPSNITIIDSRAFYNCSKLASVTIGNSVTSIYNSAFEGCSSLVSITIPDSVTSIGDFVFYKCDSLESITIPDSVTSIGDWVLSNCRSLVNIKYQGNREQWKNIKRLSSSFEKVPTSIVHCSDGDSYLMAV